MKHFILAYILSFLSLTQVALSESLNGKTVGSIDIVIGPIFYKEPVPALFRLVNKAKVSTDPEILKRELLFKEGDPISDFRLAESARVLRSLPFVREVRVVPTVRGDVVDITVYAHDAWTIIPQASFSSGDGRNRLSAGLAEGNLLGQGNRLEMLYSEDSGSTGYEAVWDDRRVLGSNMDFTAALFTHNDGDSHLLRLESPFRSLLQKSAWSGEVRDSNGTGRLFKASEEDFIYNVQNTNFDFSYTLARGKPERNLHRFSLGYRYTATSFDTASEEDIRDLDLDPATLNQNPERLADDRRFSGPLLSYSNIEPDFISLNYIDRFQRVQDINLGNQMGVLVQFAPEALGSIDNSILFALTRSKGWHFSREAFLRGELTATGRSTHDGFDNSLLSAEVTYFNVLGSTHYGETFLGRHTLASSFRLDIGHDFDKDRQLRLGADNGLRGYDARAFNGDKRFILNIEDRIHVAEDVWELFNFGLSFFADVGNTTAGSLSTLVRDGVYGAAGVGLIVGFPRSTGSRVLRMDIAFPFRDGPEESKAFELRFIFSGGQIFDANLDSEDRNASRPSVAVGF